jgi:stearoyl-CoA desaturase (delta-9 desaturase)
MLKLYRSIKNMSTYQQVLPVQALMHLVFLWGVFQYWNATYLIIGLIISWSLFWIGGSISLHRWICHRAFEPRNKLVKWFLLWAGIQCTLGSIPGFAGAHRLHHAYSDTDRDPFVLKNNLWHNVKLWFYHFPKMSISPKMIVDLMRDKDIKLSYTHYWKIWAIYPLIVLATGGIEAFVYFVALPIVWMVLGMSYVTVVAHSPRWRKMFKAKTKTDSDWSWDSKFFSILFAGEGFHGCHHKDPSQSDYSNMSGKFDASGWLIRYLKV